MGFRGITGTPWHIEYAVSIEGKSKRSKNKCKPKTFVKTQTSLNGNYTILCINNNKLSSGNITNEQIKDNKLVKIVAKTNIDSCFTYKNQQYKVIEKNINADTLYV